MRKIVQIYFLLGVATASAAGINPGSGGGGGGGGLTSPVVVADGGTGKTSLTAYALMAGGTTSTGDMQQVSGVGSAGQCLLSAGAGALPAWGSCGTVTLTVGSSALASGTAGRVLFEGTGNVVQENANLTWDNTNFILSATGAVRSGGGSNSAPGFSFTGDTNTGIVWPAADTIGFVVGGAEYMRLGSTGNVSIGTTGDNGQLTVSSTGSQNVITAIDDGATVFTLENQGTARFAAASGIGADHVIITSGTLASTKRALALTATLSTTLADQTGVDFTVVSRAASNGGSSTALIVGLSAGYTGTDRTMAGRFANSAAGTGTDPLTADGANYGVYNTASATTTGYNLGTKSVASNGNANFGTWGHAITAKNSATNVGVLGLGLNTGTSPVHVGGYFGLQSTLPTFASAALMADNGSTTSNILTLRDNGTNVLESQDSGKLLVKNSSNSTTAYQFQNAAGTNALVIDTSNLRVTTPVLMAGTAPIANSDWSTFGGVVNAGGTGVVSSVVTTSSNTDYDCLVLENTGSGASVVSSLCMFGSSFVSGGTWFNPANGSRFRTSANATAGMVFDTGAGPIYFGTSDVERVKLTDNGLENGNASFSSGDVRFNDSVSIAGQVKMDSQSAGPFTCDSGNEGRFYYRSTGSKSGLCVCGADAASYSFQVSAAHNGFAAGDC